MHKPSFYAGILVALAVVASFDQQVLFDEIVKQVHEDELIKTA